MKKVTKLKLSEMAKKMPVLTAQEQMECVGRGIYYNEEGTYLGKIGDSVDIRITNHTTFNSLSGCADDSYLKVYSSQFSQTTDSGLKFAIINSMALGIGITSGIKMGHYKPIKNGQCDNSGVITINYDSNNFLSGNYYDFLMTLYHEKHHSDTLYDSGQTISEYEAYKHVYNRPEFKHTSDRYKELTINGMDYYEQLL